MRVVGLLRLSWISNGRRLLIDYHGGVCALLPRHIVSEKLLKNLMQNVPAV